MGGIKWKIQNMPDTPIGIVNEIWLTTVIIIFQGKLWAFIHIFKHNLRQQIEPATVNWKILEKEKNLDHYSNDTNSHSRHSSLMFNQKIENYIIRFEWLTS
jgi:hypothetical protein